MERFKNDFLEAVGNDLNTSLGVTALYDVLKAGVNDATKRATLDSFDQVLGLELLSHADALKAQQAAPVEGAEEIEALIAKRLEAKRAKNWAEADAIRDQLRAMGVEIKDGKDGTTWTRIEAIKGRRPENGLLFASLRVYTCAEGTSLAKQAEYR